MKLINRILLPLALLFCCGTIRAQVNLSWNDSYDHLNWREFIRTVEEAYPVQFFYDTDSFPENIILKYSLGNDFISRLNSVLKNFNYISAIDSEGNIFISRHDSIFTTIPAGFFRSSEEKPVTAVTNVKGKNENGLMKLNPGYTEQRITIGKNTYGGKERITISGYIKNTSDNSPLIGVIVRIEGTNSAVLTDVSGFYALNAVKGDQRLIAGNLETKEKKINLRVLSDGRLDIMLDPKLVTLNAVIISADKEQIVKSTQMGYQRLATKEIKEIPVILGEQDVIKVSMLLPGIQSVGEGSSGVNVRGGPTDQNLFIINNIPVYNASHLLGFFSAFNSDAIKDFELYKSNIPVSFGGRLSSVFDIRTKQGNQNHFTANGGISPVTARLTVEGPIRNKKSSYLIGVRSTYSDWILKHVKDKALSKSNAGFADAVTDFSFDISKNDRLRFSSYHSYDKIDIIGKNIYQYINHGASGSWNHLVNEKNNFNLSLIYSQYDFTEKNAEIAISSYQDNFSVKHGEIKGGYTFRPSANHTITAGLNSMLYIIDQGNFKPLNNESLISPLVLNKEKAVESALFIADEWALTKRLILTGGLRYNYYVYLGPGDVKNYAANATRSLQNIIDTVTYGNNQIIKTYQSPDIRLAARFLVNDHLSFKASFTQMEQYLFMLTNTIAISPTDKWKLCDYHIRPVSGNQYSFGIYKTLWGGKLDIIAETYYKNIRNLVEFKNGANLVVNETPEIDVVQGDLEAYGFEIMINKPKGRFNGWLNYTWSKAMVTLNRPYEEEQINDGEPYPSNYDKPHALNLVANLKFSRRLSISSNVVYSTGRSITYPTGFYFQDDIKIPLYSRRNEYRIPDYFRIDFSVKLEGNLLLDKWAHGTWIFSVYNVTGRRNAYSVYFRTEDEILRGYRLSIFAVPVVSLTYSFKLGNYAD